MQHKAEAGGQHGIETPRYEAPVEKRICARPVLNGAHLSNMRLLRIRDPLAERVKQDVRGEAAGEDHRAPGKERILRFLSRLSQRDRADRRKAHPQRNAENAQPYDEVISPHFISKKTPDRAERTRRALRINNKEETQRKDRREGIDCRRGIDPEGFLCSVFILVTLLFHTFPPNRSYNRHRKDPPPPAPREYRSR